jgi:hypothetical protein
MTEQIISFCGDVCSLCPRYVATLNNDTEALKKFAALWFRLGFRPEVIDPEQMKCYGCNRDMACSNGINNCIHLKKINNCGECQHFPCDKINAVFEKTDKTNTICKGKCTEEEYNVLCNAFLLKREILTKINIEHRNKNHFH